MKYKYRIIFISILVLGFIILHNISIAQERWVTFSTKEGLPNKFIKDIKTDGKNIYVATANGFAIININNNKVTTLDKKDGLADNYVSSIDVDNDYVWLATDNGLSRYEKTTGKFVTYTKQDGLVDNALSAVLVDGDYIWVGTKYWGLNRFDRTLNKWDKFSIIDGLVDNSINCFAVDSSAIWIGTKNGLSYYDKITGTLSGYDTTQGLPVGNIKAIQMSGQYIWLGSVNGLIRFDKYEEKFKTYTTEDGLADDFIQGLSLDGNYLWIGTFSGVTKYDLLQGKWFTYTIKDGLIENSTSAIAVNGNYIWMGTDGGGISRFDTDIPQAMISPASYYSKPGVITIIGTAFHYNNISSYKIEYKNDAMKDFISTGVQLANSGNVINSKLADWDVSKLINLNYDVRLTVTDKKNQKNIALGTFIVDTKPPQITLDPMPEAVKDPTVFIKGTYISENIKEILITINKTTREKATVNRVLKKYEKEIQLNSGLNEINVTAYNIANLSSGVDLKVLYGKEKPVITLDPYPKQTTQPEITLSGSVRGSGIQKIILNPGNEEISFSKKEENQFTFEHKVNLDAGVNKFEITAYDLVGNKAADSPVIEFTSSVPVISLDKSILNVNSSNFIVKGTWAGINIKNINIEPFFQNAVIDFKNKTFTYKARLKEGENVITADILDKANNKNFDVMNIFYSLEKTKFDLSAIPEFSSTKIANIEGTFVEQNLDKIFVKPGNIPAAIDKANNKFSLNLTLENDVNKFEIIMQDKFGVQYKKEFKITYVATPPKLDVNRIPDTVYANSVNITGKYDTDYLDKIMIMPGEIKCNINKANNSFSCNLKLNEGKNDFRIIVYDKAQNNVSLDASVVYVTGGQIVAKNEGVVDTEYVKQLKAEVERLKALLKNGNYTGMPVETEYRLPQKSGLAIVSYNKLKANTLMDISQKYLGGLIHMNFINKYNNIQLATADNKVLIPTKNYIRNYMDINSSKVKDILDIIAISYRYSFNNFEKFKKQLGLFMLNKNYFDHNAFNTFLRSNVINLNEAVISFNKKVNSSNPYVINIYYNKEFMGIDISTKKMFSKNE